MAVRVRMPSLVGTADSITGLSVSFVVPCYKLAHLLAQCVGSILSQTHRDLEVLILDDCSPDNTPEVAASFDDPRVRHIRNEPNLGHLRNYNKGIGLARGKYIWLISADDFLCDDEVLARYVAAMDRDGNIGFACSAGFELTSDGRSQVAEYSVVADHDCVFDGHAFLRQLLYANSVLAASGMVRRSCYEALGAFPLDLPYAGDWYLWCLFAMHYKVSYFSAPAVTYRIHERSMTETLLERNVRVCIQDDLQVLWRIDAKARETGNESLINLCEHAVAYFYARCLVLKRYRTAVFSLDTKACLESIRGSAKTCARADSVWSRVQVSAGDLCRQRQDLPGARRFYREASRLHPFRLTGSLKYLLHCMGPLGSLVRRGIAATSLSKV